MKCNDKEKLEVINKVIQLIHETVELNPQYEFGLWVTAFYYMSADSFRQSGFSYEDFCKDMDGIKETYKNLWDQHEMD